MSALGLLALILSVPLFLLCGAVMTEGGAARRLVRIVRAVTTPTRGGLGVAAIISCAVFAAISGSSIVTMIAVGSVLYPAMKEAGYTNRFALGTVVSGGTRGIIIPPSIPLILYGLVTETSIVDLFLAGILIVNLLLLAVGAFMTTNEAILILGPILMPVAQAYGFHPVHFGIIMIVNLEIGYLTPPVGMNLMVALVTFKQKFGELVKSVLPYIAIMVIGLIIITAVPWLSLGLL